MPAKKIDLRKELGPFYKPPSKEPVVVDVPPMNFLMIDGAGGPTEGTEFQDAIQVLYGMAYTLKFSLKKQGIAEYPVMPLEALWGTEGGAFDLEDRANWRWIAMIVLPDVVTRAHVEKARAQLKEKRDPKALPKLRIERFDEGRAAQIMHIGPYAEERPTIQRLHDFIRAKGGKPVGRHHEIYLGDPRKADPSKQKTVLRQPFRE